MGVFNLTTEIEFHQGSIVCDPAATPFGPGLIFLNIHRKAVKAKKRGQTGKKNRDYLKPESNKIAISRNRVEIYNPGAFPEGLTPEDFIQGKEQSILRNPLLADVLFKSKEIEKWGSGLKRIYEECLEYRVKIEFEILKTGFVAVFYRKEKEGKA